MPFSPFTQLRDASQIRSMRPWWLAGLAFCVLMLIVHTVAGLNSAGVADFWRDLYWATSIAHGERFPLAGPPIYGMIELGPWWFYLLALPMVFGANAAVTSAFVQALAALKYFLAWAIGNRLGDARLGFAFASSLAIAGWATLPLIFPTHTALIETSVLFLAVVTWRGWARFRATEAVLLGLATAACLHAHPTTASYVVLAGILLLWRHRRPATVGWMGLAVLIAVASLLPPWLERSAAVAAELKPVSGYVVGDLASEPLRRIPLMLRSLTVGGAWWGFLLMTPWSLHVVRVAWCLWCGGMLFALAGLVRLRSRRPALVRLAMLASAVFLAQLVFVVMLRRVTPMWMVPSMLPPLALFVALGWYGWLDARARLLRIAGGVVMALVVGLSLAPFSLFMRDIHRLRVMPNVNPFADVIDTSDRFISVPVPFYPLYRIDRMAAHLCTSAVLHGRLAAVFETALAAPLRSACGYWPELRYGGVAGEGAHVAGLLPRMAVASAIKPSRIVAGMALYKRVLPIAPPQGGVALPLRRLQIVPLSSGLPPAQLDYEFQADVGDAVLLTNRMSSDAPMTDVRVESNGEAARLLAEDGSSFLYACSECAPRGRVNWRVRARGVEHNLDLVVLVHDQHGATSTMTVSP